MLLTRTVNPENVTDTLYALGLSPNQMAFWVMQAAADAALKEPFRLTAIRGELYPEITKQTGLSSDSIDSLLRRTSKQMMARESFAPLRAYLPNGAKMPPTVGVFLSAWVRMVANNATTGKPVPNLLRDKASA